MGKSSTESVCRQVFHGTLLAGFRSYVTIMLTYLLNKFVAGIIVFSTFLLNFSLVAKLFADRLDNTYNFVISTYTYQILA